MSSDEWDDCDCDPADPTVIHGRPDHGNPDFGVTTVRRFPPYVFSRGGQGALVHAVARMELHWYECHGDHLTRLTTPRVVAICRCGATFFPGGRRTHHTCQVPPPGALLCGRCHGEGPRFQKTGDQRARQEARRWLGYGMPDE